MLKIRTLELRFYSCEPFESFSTSLHFISKKLQIVYKEDENFYDLLLQNFKLVSVLSLPKRFGGATLNEW